MHIRVRNIDLNANCVFLHPSNLDHCIPKISGISTSSITQELVRNTNFWVQETTGLLEVQTQFLTFIPLVQVPSVRRMG